MIIAFEATCSVDLVQAIGRGARNVIEEVSPSLILNITSKLLQSTKSPYELKIQREKINKVKDRRTAKMLQKLHKKALKCWNRCSKNQQHKEDSLLKTLLKDRLSFHIDFSLPYKIDEKDKKECGYKIGWATFEYAGLRETGFDLIKYLSK